jgi:hypothetical protein
MAECPECGTPAQATTQDDDTGESFYECENGHVWPTEGG